MSALTLAVSQKMFLRSLLVVVEQKYRRTYLDTTVQYKIPRRIPFDVAHGVQSIPNAYDTYGCAAN